jgi:hypothetical protein
VRGGTDESHASGVQLCGCWNVVLENGVHIFRAPTPPPEVGTYTLITPTWN